MKKKYYVLIAILIGMMTLFVNNKVEAANIWGTDPTKLTSVIPENGQANLNLDSNTIQLGFNKAYTQYTIYYSGGKTTVVNASDITTNYTFTLAYNEYVKASYMGTYAGKNIDMTIRNTNTNMQAANMTITSDGVIEASNLSANTSFGSTLKPAQQFTLMLLYHDTGEALKGVPFLLTQYQKNDASQYSVTYGFQKSAVKQLYALGNTTASKSAVYDSTTYGLFNVENISSSLLSYVYYGTTGSSTGEINLYAGVKPSITNRIKYNIINATDEYNIIPLKYPSSTTTITSTTSDGGQYVNLDIEQPFVTERLPVYYPKDGTMKMTITQLNMDYLSYTNDDFTLTADGVAVDKSKYTVSTSQLGIRENITINFLSNFAMQYAGKTIKIHQKSRINSSQASISSNLQTDQTLKVASTAKLSYTMNDGIYSSSAVTISSLGVTGAVKVVPDLTGDAITGQSVNLGTTLSSIPIENVIGNVRDTYYTWDKVTASYKDPTQVLNADGIQPIEIVLTSGTFKNQVTVTSSVTVSSSYSLNYMGNGGTVNESASYQTSFTPSGIALLSSNNVTRSGYTFIGWSTNSSSTTSEFVGEYNYGTKPTEQKDTTLYAIWKKNPELSVSWNNSSTVSTSTKVIDKSQSSLVIPFYWYSTVEGTSYTVKQTVNGVTTDVTKLTQATSDLTNTKTDLSIDTGTLPYGTSNYVFSFYELNNSGSVINSQTPSGQLSLSVTVSGSLRLESVPDSVDWTNRTIRSSKGLLNRDNANTIKLDVLDSRQSPKTNWYVQANATLNNTTMPFTFVWKSNRASQPISMMGNSVKIMDATTSTQNGNFYYSQSWNNENGVLINSSRYVSSGDYTNVATINWTLYDVAKAN